MGGEACGIGEGTHYGCECVMRRLAEAEARASGLESALAVAGEENAALTESRDAALRSLASEQARRETAERERDRHLDSECRMAVDSGRNERWARWWKECAKEQRASLSAALRRAEELTTALRGLIMCPGHTPNGTPVLFVTDEEIERARALSVGVSRTGGER
jgi:single-stranded DNA-specific DHH superfamily exonuclease